MKIGLIFGSTTGNTEDVAQAIRGHLSEFIDEARDVEHLKMSSLLDYDVLLIGIPTWDVGGLQDSWDFKLKELKPLDLAGKRVGFFGQGDQTGYPESFQDAMGMLRDEFIAQGATADFGFWPVDEYEFEESKGLIGDKFVGLPLDEHNQSELTEERIEQWCIQIRKELGLDQTAAAE